MASPVHARRVFVGGIAWKATEKDVQEYFQERFGCVQECKLITDRETGKSKGYGFVTFTDEKVAELVKACKDLNLQGKTMNADNAFRKESKSPRKPSPSTETSSPPTQSQEHWYVYPYPNGSVYPPYYAAPSPMVPSQDATMPSDAPSDIHPVEDSAQAQVPVMPMMYYHPYMQYHQYAYWQAYQQSLQQADVEEGEDSAKIGQQQQKPVLGGHTQ